MPQRSPSCTLRPRRSSSERGHVAQDCRAKQLLSTRAVLRRRGKRAVSRACRAGAQRRYAVLGVPWPGGSRSRSAGRACFRQVAARRGRRLAVSRAVTERLASSWGTSRSSWAGRPRKCLIFKSTTVLGRCAVPAEGTRTKPNSSSDAGFRPASA
jgi:hypothetical protein